MIISFFICAWMGGYVERHVSKVVPIDVRWARPMHYFHGFLEVIPAKPCFQNGEFRDVFTSSIQYHNSPSRKVSCGRLSMIS